MKKLFVSIFIILLLTTVANSEEKKELDKNVLKMVEKTCKQYNSLEIKIYNESHDEIIRFKKIELPKMKKVILKMIDFVKETGSIEAALPQIKKEIEIYRKLAIKKQNNFLKRLIYLKDQHKDLIEKHASLADDPATLIELKKEIVNRKNDPFLKNFSKTGKKIGKEWKEIVNKIDKIYLKIVEKGKNRKH